MSNIVRFDVLRSLAFASITNSYVALGVPFDHAMRLIHFINNTDGDMLVSFDGINDNTIILAESFALYDLTAQQDIAEHFRYQNGTQLFVKYVTAPTGPVTGAFYACCVYGKGE